ncbi:hypothetical protein H6P81_009026 [Aristolochia fimbriata]|uniref:Uncharacterized protein n=1 Tax=Aristolochia fimbriata TaxID=158543 RepID=A0AAV7EKX0_ARIFI|nr:hypothetical protein H6P81_009026 [Aristolochia fimbriata]
MASSSLSSCFAPCKCKNPSRSRKIRVSGGVRAQSFEEYRGVEEKDRGAADAGEAAEVSPTRSGLVLPVRLRRESQKKTESITVRGDRVPNGEDFRINHLHWDFRTLSRLPTRPLKPLSFDRRGRTSGELNLEIEIFGES